MQTYAIPDMSCGHCVGAVTRAVKELDPAASVEVDLASRTCRVDAKAGPEAIQARWREAGYPSALVGD